MLFQIKELKKKKKNRFESSLSIILILGLLNKEGFKSSAVIWCQLLFQSCRGCVVTLTRHWFCCYSLCRYSLGRKENTDLGLISLKEGVKCFLCIFEQPGLVEGVPAAGRGLDYMICKYLPTQTIL